MIFWVPTPLAIPAQRRSTSRMMLQRSAHAWLIIVIWAPKNHSQVLVVLTKDTTACAVKTGTQCCGKKRLLFHILAESMLITWVNKSFHRVPIHSAVDVEHNHLSEAFWGLLHGNVHVFLHIVLPEICTNKKGDGQQKLKHAAWSWWTSCFVLCDFYNL